MPKNILRFLLLAGGIAAAIVLVELLKNKAIGAFWNITGAA
jgi:hypothetical protein